MACAVSVDPEQLEALTHAYGREIFARLDRSATLPLSESLNARPPASATTTESVEDVLQKQPPLLADGLLRKDLTDQVDDLP